MKGTATTPCALTHEERQSLIRRPYPITYIPPQKRWGGVQLINDEDWMRDANAWRKKYADEGVCDAPEHWDARNNYSRMGGVQ